MAPAASAAILVSVRKSIFCLYDREYMASLVRVEERSDDPRRPSIPRRRRPRMAINEIGMRNKVEDLIVDLHVHEAAELFTNLQQEEEFRHSRKLLRVFV